MTPVPLAPAWAVPVTASAGFLWSDRVLHICADFGLSRMSRLARRVLCKFVYIFERV